VANKCTLFILFLYVTFQFYKNKIKSVHLLATKFTSITKMHGATHIKMMVYSYYVFRKVLRQNIINDIISVWYNLCLQLNVFHNCDSYYDGIVSKVKWLGYKIRNYLKISSFWKITAMRFFIWAVKNIYKLVFLCDVT
jgi:hypothetical protein